MTRRPHATTVSRIPPLARWGALASLVVAVGAFVLSFSLLAADHDAAGRLKELERQGALVLLPHWHARESTCRGEDADGPLCLEIGPARPLDFPMAHSGGAERNDDDRGVEPGGDDGADRAAGTGHMVLTPVFTPAVRAWLADRPWAVLLVPRHAHNETWLRAGSARARAVGMGNDLALHFRTDSLEGDDSIALVVDRRGLPWFGPADGPPALVDPEALATAQSLSTRLLFASDLQSQLEIGFPLVSAGVALVLDHAPVFALASAYGTLRAVRAAFVAHLLHGELGAGAVWPYIYAALNAACAIALVATAHSLSGGSFRTRVTSLFAVATVMAFLVFQARMPDFELIADLLADSLGALVGLASCVANIARNVRHAKSATHARDEGLPGHAPSRKAMIVVALLLFSGLGLHGWVNASELLSSGGGPSRNPLDWRHAVLFPSLLTASLVSVGSLARRMTVFARRFAHDALVAKEVSLARELHERTLPPRTNTEGPHAWRLFHVPASSMSGDWADVRHVTLADGRRVLAACVVDVTGHGLGAALITGAVCAQWRLWSRTLEELDATAFTAAKETLLNEASRAVHGALVAVGREDTCTAVFMLHDPVAAELTFLTCGHPGILHARQGSTLDYLRTPGSGLGLAYGAASRALAPTPRSLPTKPGDVFALFSDGLVPANDSLTSWVRRLQKAAPDPAFSLARKLGRQVRTNRTRFRRDRDGEDDLTLLLVSFGTREGNGAKGAADPKDGAGAGPGGGVASESPAADLPIAQ